MGVLLATAAMILAGVGSLCFQSSVARIGAARTTWLDYAFGLVMTAVAPLVMEPGRPLNRAGVAWAAAAALVLSLSVLCFNASLRSLKVSTATTLSSFEFVVAIVLAVLFRGEALTAKEWGAAGLAVAAIVLYAS